MLPPGSPVSLGTGVPPPLSVPLGEAAMPPLVDLDETEIEEQWSRRATQQWQLRVSLLAPDGPTGSCLIVDLRGDDQIIGLVGFDGPVPDPVHAYLVLNSPPATKSGWTVGASGALLA